MRVWYSTTPHIMNTAEGFWTKKVHKCQQCKLRFRSARALRRHRCKQAPAED